MIDSVLQEGQQRSSATGWSGVIACIGETHTVSNLVNPTKRQHYSASCAGRPEFTLPLGLYIYAVD